MSCNEKFKEALYKLVLETELYSLDEFKEVCMNKLLLLILYTEFCLFFHFSSVII